jgi:diacylglycerol kinase
MKNYLTSFSDAFRGVYLFFRMEFNARVHLLATFLALLLAWISDFNSSEWLWLILAIALVFLSEMFNTALELFCNRMVKGHDSEIGKIKDISAGAVLVSAILASIIALFLFIPKWI